MGLAVYTPKTVDTERGEISCNLQAVTYGPVGGARVYRAHP